MTVGWPCDVNVTCSFGQLIIQQNSTVGPQLLLPEDLATRQTHRTSTRDSNGNFGYSLRPDAGQYGSSSYMDITGVPAATISVGCSSAFYLPISPLSSCTCSLYQHFLDLKKKNKLNILSSPFTLIMQTLDFHNSAIKFRNRCNHIGAAEKNQEISFWGN